MVFSFKIKKMNSITTSVRHKMSKVETSLLDLNKEITAAGSFLQRLKQHSTKIVQELNSLSSPAAYLEEFVQVNSFLLKYLGFLTEINCKFEMMQILDNDLKSEQTNKTSEITCRFDGIPFNSCDPLKNLKETNSLKSSRENSEDSPNGLQSSPSQKTWEINPKETQSLPSQLQIENLNLRKWSIKSESDITDDSFENHLPEEPSLHHSETHNNKNDINVGYLRSTYIHSSSSSLNDQRENEITEESVLDIQANLSSDKPKMEKSTSSSLDLIYTSVSDESNETFTLVDKTPRYPTPEETTEIQPSHIITKAGDEFEVIVKHVNSPSEFYVHIVNNQLNLLKELEKRLKLIPVETFKITNHKREFKKDLLNNEIGEFALYYSKCDEAWYRAKVTDWCLTYEDDFVYIFLLDYGESKCVSVETLQAMPKVLKKYPSFAQRCHLDGVYPMDAEEHGDSLSWGKESSEKMRCLIENSSKLKIKILTSDRYNPFTSLPVTLWLVDQGNQSVNELLVDSKHAVEKKSIEEADDDEDTNNSHSAEEKNLENWNPMKEDFESYQNLYELNLNDPAAVIYGYVGKDYDRVCRHFLKSGRCFKGDACSKEHAYLDPSGFTLDKEEVYRNAFNSMPPPQPNQILHVQVTCFSSVNKFCCFPCTNNWGHEESLSSLLKFMNSHNNVREMRKLLIPPSAGQIVIAQYTEDNLWYRAKILESQPEADSYAVVFVDYGNKETLPLSRIKAIEPRYLHLPFQAIQCYIFGIKQNPLISSEKALSYLNKRIGEGQIRIEVVSKLPGEDVILFVNVFDQNRENIAADLIAKGFALYKQDILISADSATLPG